MQAKFVISASKPNQLPGPTSPEIAFVGRSNCGKSSLINAVCNQKNLARTSQTPGRTQLANFFTLNDKLTLIDLPGYGFSATGKSARRSWQDLTEAVLQRPSLAQVFFLIDVRRKLDTEDRDLVRFCASLVPVSVVLTKTDKTNQSHVAKTKSFIEADLISSGITLTQVFPTSTLKSKGIAPLTEFVLSLA